MDLPITTPALLFPAIAILMLGYVNRYLATANVIRTFKKDYDSGQSHVEMVRQLKILTRRIELSRHMLTVGALSLACLSMFLIFIDQSDWGKIVFGLSIVGMIISLMISLYETFLSNKSLLIEITDVINKENKQS